MNAAWQGKALKAADEMERQAQVLREAVRIMDGRATANAKQAFSGKMAEAIKLTASRGPDKHKRGLVVNTVKQLLASGPKTFQEMKDGLAGLVAAKDVSSRLLTIHNNGHITRTGPQGHRTYALKNTAKTRHNSRNGASPIYPVTLPTKMNHRQKKSASSYAIWQMGQAANGASLSSQTILANLKHARLKPTGQAIGAAIRYGILTTAPDSTKKNPRYLVTDKTAADFPHFTQAE